MKKRVGATVFIQLIPANSHETTTTVELALRILFVDVYGRHAASPHSVYLSTPRPAQRRRSAPHSVGKFMALELGFHPRFRAPFQGFPKQFLRPSAGFGTTNPTLAAWMQPAGPTGTVSGQPRPERLSLDSNIPLTPAEVLCTICVTQRPTRPVLRRSALRP